MSWNFKTIQPKRPATASGANRMLSPSLIRFCGAIGFSVFGLGSLKLGMRILGVDSDAWLGSSLSKGFIFVIVVSLILGFVGGVAGLAFGAQFRIRSSSVNYIIAVLWHYLANGTLILTFLLGLTLSKIYGKEGTKKFVIEFGSTRMTIYTILICSLGSLTIGSVLLLTGLLNENDKPQLAFCLAISLPIALATTYVLFAALGVASSHWVFIGALFAPLLILTSAYMINRDLDARRILSQ